MDVKLLSKAVSQVAFIQPSPAFIAGWEVWVRFERDTNPYKVGPIDLKEGEARGIAIFLTHSQAARYAAINETAI